MFRIRSPFLFLVFLALFTPKLTAASCKWTYYKAGTNTGEIVVAGVSTPDAGFTLQTNTAIAVVWIMGDNGGVQSAPFGLTIDAKTGVWTGSLKGLTSGQAYNIIVQTPAVMGLNTQIISPPPQTATAK